MVGVPMSCALSRLSSCSRELTRPLAATVPCACPAARRRAGARRGSHAQFGGQHVGHRLQALLAHEAQVLGLFAVAGQHHRSWRRSSRCRAFSTGISFLHTGQVGDRKNTSVGRSVAPPICTASRLDAAQREARRGLADRRPGVGDQRAHRRHALEQHADLARQRPQHHAQRDDGQPQQHDGDGQGVHVSSAPASAVRGRGGAASGAAPRTAACPAPRRRR
jgi:hypothetical protein